MDKIISHLWFDTQALAAARYYCDVFPGAVFIEHKRIEGTPSGDVDIVTFDLPGQRFQAISAGPLFKFNPSISFMVACAAVEEVDRLWSRLIDGGSPLMDIGTYPFSARYGWLVDKYGLSWQLMHDGGRTVQAVTPSLLFTGAAYGKAEEALEFYSVLFAGDGPLPGHLSRYGEGAAPDKPEAINYARFRLLGKEFVLMESALDHGFVFNEAVSLMVYCDTQEEIDRCWDRLTADGGEEGQCGWLKDRFGLSWQIVPTVMDEMMRTDDKAQLARVTQAFLAMRKFDIAALEKAARGD